MTRSRSLSPRRSLRLAGWELKTRLRFPSSHSRSWGWDRAQLQPRSQSRSPAHQGCPPSICSNRQVSHTFDGAGRACAGSAAAWSSLEAFPCRGYSAPPVPSLVSGAARMARNRGRALASEALPRGASRLSIILMPLETHPKRATMLRVCRAFRVNPLCVAPGRWNDRLPGVVDLMDVRHPAVVDAIAPPAVTTDNVERFRRVELRSLHWGEPFSQQGYSTVFRASMIALYRSRKVRTLRAPRLPSAINSALRYSAATST